MIGGCEAIWSTYSHLLPCLLVDIAFVCLSNVCVSCWLVIQGLVKHDFVLVMVVVCKGCYVCLFEQGFV